MQTPCDSSCEVLCHPLQYPWITRTSTLSQVTQYNPFPKSRKIFGCIGDDFGRSVHDYLYVFVVLLRSVLRIADISLNGTVARQKSDRLRGFQLLWVGSLLSPPRVSYKCSTSVPQREWRTSLEQGIVIRAVQISLRLSLALMQLSTSVGVIRVMVHFRS